MEISKELLNNCLKRNNLDIHELYKRCYSLMKGISLRYQKSEVDAEIAFNQGFLKVIDNLSKYYSSRSFKTWFTRVIVNTNIDIYRARKRHSEITVYKEAFTGQESFVEVYDHSDPDETTIIF